MAAPYSNTPSLSTQPHPTSATTALRRRHALQPPSLLTASLDNARRPGLATVRGAPQTSVSTTSLSTPFSPNLTQSPYPQSPGTAMRGSLPLTYRSNPGPSVPYNPQQWGPVSDASPQPASTAQGQQRYMPLAPRPVGPDEPVASPPPPYSPRRNQDGQPSPRHADIASPSATTSSDTDSPQNGTPISTATTSVSPDLYAIQSRNREILQTSSASASPNLGSAPAFPPPPPVGPKSKPRTLPKISTNGLLSSLRTKAPISAGGADAINNSQSDTRRVPQYAPESSRQYDSVHPPAARRAASTGGIGFANPSSHSNGNSPIPVAWESNMPLPPPPPGPPPSAARTQSLNRFTQSSSTTLNPMLPFRHRLPPGSGTVLSTVPPTPADWRDESPEPSQAHRNRSRSNGPALHIDTGSIIQKRPEAVGEAVTASAAVPSHVRRDSSSTRLFRSPAVRNRSAKGIRERRSESRNGKGRESEDLTTDDFDREVAPWDRSPENNDVLKPADLVLSTTQHHSTSDMQNRTSSPRSGKSMQSLDGVIKSPEVKTSSAKGVSFQSVSPAAQPSSARSHDTSTSHTPVFSPKVDTLGSPAAIHSISSSRTAGPSGGMSLAIPPDPAQRPISHLLHIPITEDTMQVPLTPSTKASQRPVSDLIEPETPSAFAARANERHRNFAAREAAAENDAERLDLFVQFIIAESRIRRDQYAKFFEEEGIDSEELMQGVFGLPSKKVRVDQQRDFSQDPPSTNEASRRTSNASSAIDSSEQEESSSASRMQESPGSVTSSSSIPYRQENGRAKDYVPCLSPIASMSVVTGADEMDSRGRAPSRWWEGSRSGDAHGDGFDVLARSKRESKYMGVSKDAPMSPIVYENPTSRLDSRFQQEGGEPSQQRLYGPGEYPPEKVGWHENSTTQQPLPPTPASASYTPNSTRLDISRLVTLPPPYPRHHPAVNNSHPDLDSVRSVVRSLHDASEVDTIHQSYRTLVQTKRQRAKSWQEHQRSLHQQTIDFNLSQGDLSPSQFEAAEADLSAKLAASEKETTQASFDLFQETVVTPLHALFTHRIDTATSSLHSLSTSLFSDAQSHSPNLPQEEGDEKPELLERLTMLKWLFEAREAAHRGIYDLLSDRNDLYKAIVLLPYINTNPAKQAEAERFFADDARDRLAAFHCAVASRATAFLSVIETNVSRGVEVQLDAFWQIAPPLKSLLEKIPADLEAGAGFEVLIPPKEYAENPSYVDHPLQYLYSLLEHAERASYQFIESQVNLLCLLHEIRGAALGARVRAEVAPGDGGGSEVEELMRGAREEEERRLTEDLKEKVGVVEGQWEDALGAELRAVMERIRGQLLLEGGWEDGDEDEAGGE